MRTYTQTLLAVVLLLLSPAVFAQLLEKRTGPPLEGFSDLKVFNDYVFLAGFNYADNTKGGLYRSDDEGETWTMMQQDAYPDKVVIAPNNTDLYFTTQMTGLYKSINEGQTWNLVTTPGTYVKDLDIARNGDLYLVENNKIFKSAPSTINFTEINPAFPPSGKNIQALEIFKGGSSDKFICMTLDGIYTSPDGQNWTPASGMPAVGTKSYDDIYNMFGATYFLGAALTGHGDAMIIITQDGEVYMSEDGVDFHLENSIPGINPANDVFLTKTGALPGGRLFGVVEDYYNSANSRVYQWNYRENNWTDNGHDWFGQGATGGYNRYHAATMARFQFKSGATDTTVGLILVGEEIDGTDTFRVFKTNITAGNSVGISEAEQEEKISVYPTVVSNPVITLNNPGAVRTANISLTDLSGRQLAAVDRVVLEQGDNPVTLPGGISTGHYLLRLQDTKTGLISNYRLVVAK